MGRPKEQKLYRVLKDSELSFIRRGIRSTEEIYDSVQAFFPHLCDDDYHCSHYKNKGITQSEWKHKTRSVLETLKSVDGPIRHSDTRGFWIFS